jgi:hypothetical protein
MSAEGHTFAECVPSIGRFAGRGLEVHIRHRFAVSALLTLSAVVGGSCGSSPDIALPAELNVETASTLGCDGATPVDPPANFGVVLSSVALPTSPQSPAIQAIRRAAEDGSNFYFAKAGLVWDGASSFEIVVPDRLRSQLALSWGAPDVSHSIKVECADLHGWVGLPGGYWVREPLCADLIVRTGSAEATVQVGIGAPCSDQPPPEGRSDS